MRKKPLEKILIFGATSAIAYETAKIFAEGGASLFLCARDEDEVKRIAADLLVRGARQVTPQLFDAHDADSIVRAIEASLQKFPDLDGLLVAHGMLPDQKECEQNDAAAREAFEVNFTSITTILTHIVPHFEEQGHGSIAVISSVAGDRGRQKNYIYGAAKAALSAYLSGLRQRLHKSDVGVITVKPGFVDTPMTEALEKNFLVARPEVVGRGIHKAMVKGKDVVYLPWFWRWIMLGVRMLPERLFKKLSI